MMMGATPKHDLKRRKLNFVKIDVVSSPLAAMLHSRASYNFMEEDLTRRLGLRFVLNVHLSKW